MRSPASVLLASFALTTATFGAVAPRAWAQPARAPGRAADAASHFERGVELYDEGDFSGALVEFKRAYEIAPEFRVLYNIGQASFELRDYASAQRAFRRYLDEGGDRVPSERRAQVQRDLAQLDARVARVRIAVDVAGAAVFVDGRNVGQSPLSSPVVVNVGPHEIRAEVAGHPPLLRAVDVAGREDASVVLAFRAERSSPRDEARLDVAPPPPRTGPSWTTIGAVLVASGGVVLAGALVSDLTLVKSALDDFEDKRAHDDPATAHAQSKARTLQAVTLVGYGAGALLAAGGAVILLWPKPSSPAAPSVAIGPSSIAARFAF